MIKLIQKPWRWTRALPLGLQVAMLTIALVGGRYLWISAHRPTHRHEIAAAFGSVGIYYGAPQPDRTGRRLTYVETSDRGFGVFLTDAVSGKKTVVFDEPGSGQMGDYYDLQVWPWAPDDSAFIYSQASQLVVCDSTTMKPVAKMALEEAPAALAWLTPNTFACVGKTGGLRQFEKQPDGTWGRKGAADALDNGLSLRSRGGISTASAEDSTAGATAESAMSPGGTAGWSSGKTAAPVWLQYQFNGAAWAVTQYKLTSSGGDPNADPRDWELLGSLDGKEWIKLDVRANQSFAARRESKRCAITNATPYWFYRLNITATAGGPGGTRLASFQLWSPDTPDKASASAERLPNEGAAAAFDGVNRTKWYTDRVGSRGWLQYGFGGGSAWALSGYDLVSGSDIPNRDPKDWQFQASNDGRSWTTLDTQSGQSFAGRLQTNTYALKSSPPYRFYRLNITANQSPSEASLQLAEFHLKTRDPLVKPGQPDGGSSLRSSGATMNPFAGAFSLTALSSNTIAWGQPGSLWSMNLVTNVPILMLDMKEDAPPNTTLVSFSYAEATGRFLLCCDQSRRGSLWRFAPDEPSSRLTQITTTAPVRNAVWIKSIKDGWIGMENEFFIALKNPGSPPARLLSAGIDAYTMSPDGQRLFLLGIVGLEPARGIWSYDFASAELKNVAPYADFPSPHAQRMTGTTGSARATSGDTVNYDVFTPPNYDEHSHTKYPLVIGNTQLGNIVNGAHGRQWVQGLAACGAYVVVVNTRDRGNWGGDLMAVYEKLVAEGRVDKNRAFLFGVTAGTSDLSQFVVTTPGPWKGVIYVNPVRLPDYSQLAPGRVRPRILLSSGTKEPYMSGGALPRFQAEGLKHGVLVDYVMSADQQHHFVGNAAQLERTAAMAHFIFDE